MEIKGLLNDEWFNLNEPIFASGSRAVQYGDGWFETIRVSENKILFLEEHTLRLQRTSKILACTMPPYWNELFWQKRIQQVCEANNWKNARIKILIFRDASGNYLPATQDLGWVISGTELNESTYNLNSEGIKLITYGQSPKPSDMLSLLKTNSTVRYVQAATYAMRNGGDEAALINQAGRICEASSSNLFLVKDGLIMTPSLSEYCLDGIMRKIILQLAPDLEMDIIEAPIIDFEFQNADEVFLTNVIKGVRWVSGFDSIKYSQNEASAQLVEGLNKKFISL